MKHTPGPWYIKKGFSLVVRNGTDGTICSTGGDTDKRLEEHQANAKLIAAAPEMLNFLKNFVSMANDTTGKIYRVDYAAIEDLINKVEGES